MKYFKLLFFLTPLIYLMVFCHGNQKNKSANVLVEKWDNGNIKTMQEYFFPFDSTNFDVTGYYRNGVKNYFFSFRYSRQNGKSEYYYKDGKIKCQINYLNDVKNGECKFWHPNGQLAEFSHYKDGKVNGQSYGYNENGKLIGYSLFNQGYGISKTFYPTGQLAKYSRIRNGKEDGIITSYFRNGRKAKEIKFVEGIKNGPYYVYYKSGKIMERGFYKDNLITEFCIYKENGEEDYNFMAFYKEYKNSTPWTNEQIKKEVDNCAEIRRLLGEAFPKNYCVCYFDKVQLFLSYSAYKSKSTIKWNRISKLIAILCEDSYAP